MAIFPPAGALVGTKVGDLLCDWVRILDGLRIIRLQGHSRRCIFGRNVKKRLNKLIETSTISGPSSQNGADDSRPAVGYLCRCSAGDSDHVHMGT